MLVVSYSPGNGPSPKTVVGRFVVVATRESEVNLGINMPTTRPGQTDPARLGRLHILKSNA